MSDRGARGLFIKTPSPHIVEILGTSGLDFAVLDAEHAPLDRSSLDLMLLAGRAASMPLFVRTADQRASAILAALDLGAAGVVVPHVDTIEIAREVAASARYRGGTRGYSGAPRHAGYGTVPMATVIATADKARVIVQIEHPDAVPLAREMLSLEAVDGILVGRADLAIAMGEENTGAERVEAAVRQLFDAVRDSGKIKGVVVGSEAERADYAAQGANWFIMGNDQGLLRTAAIRLLSQ